MKATTRVILLIGASLAILLGGMIAVFAAPTGPDTITLINSSRRTDTTAGQPVYAEAGNVTELNIYDIITTTSWQGYYGNVSGTITLDDAAGNSMYNWNLADPQGEIYAANASVSAFSTASCVRLTSDGLGTSLNESILESNYNISSLGGDGFAETFNWTFGGSFQVGTKTIGAANGCSQTYTYVNDGPQARDFPEVILGADANKTLIFTTLLNQSIDGFKSGSNDKYDFQMLVAENGGDPSTTPYYFYVELS